MSLVGPQSIWVVGSRFLFKESPKAGIEQPTVDLGTIETVNPTFNITQLTLQDGDGGVKKTIAKNTTGIDETYEITTRNFNPRNLSFLFLADPPTPYTIAETENVVTHYAHVANLVKLKFANGDYAYDIKSIAGLALGTGVQFVVTTVVAAAKTITVTGNASTLAPGDLIVLGATGLANALNAGVYTVDSTTGSGPTTITVEEAPVANETAVTGVLITEALVEGTDWEFYTQDGQQRGVIRMIPTSATFTVTGNVFVLFTPKAKTGDRMMKPQKRKGQIEGEGWIFWGRDNFASQTVRRAKVQISPGNTSFTIDDFSSATFQVTVVSEITDVDPAGELIEVIGDLPPVS